MSDKNPADIPATKKFQECLKIIQEEYKNALKTGEHPDKEKISYHYTSGQHFSKQCQIIYEDKVDKLCLYIIKYHKTTSSSHIDLNSYTRFNELVWNAKHKTHDFLNTI
jgi:hypothetical protein